MRVGRTARIFASVVGFRRGLLGGRARNPRKPLAEATGDDARPSSCGRFINRAVYFPGGLFSGRFHSGRFHSGRFHSGRFHSGRWLNGVVGDGARHPTGFRRGLLGGRRAGRWGGRTRNAPEAPRGSDGDDAWHHHGSDAVKSRCSKDGLAHAPAPRHRTCRRIPRHPLMP